MKTKIIILSCILFATIMSCEENESVPPFQTQGTATATVASITTSKATPAIGETVTLTMRFVNLASDPIQQMVLKAKVGTAEYVEVQTFNESSSPVGEEIVRTIDVVAPATKATTVLYDMVLTSAKPYPLVRRVQIKTPN